jgi:hypothetical protein
LGSCKVGFLTYVTPEIPSLVEPIYKRLRRAFKL